MLFDKKNASSVGILSISVCSNNKRKWLHIHTRPNRHKKERDRQRQRKGSVNECNAMKQRTKKTNQNNRWKKKRTQEQIYTRASAHTQWINTIPVMIIKIKETQIYLYIYIYIYQESDVVTGVDDVNLCVFVGGCMQWSWTNCTRPLVDDVDGGGGVGVEGITYDRWCWEKHGVVGGRTNVDDVLVKNCCWSSECSCWLRSISLLIIVDDGGGVGGVDSNIICCDVEIEFDDDNGGEDEGDGGCGSTSVDRAWLTRRDEHEYGWSSSMDDDGGYLPFVGNEIEKFCVDFDCWWCANDIVWSLTVRYEWRR